MSRPFLSDALSRPLLILLASVMLSTPALAQTALDSIPHDPTRLKPSAASGSSFSWELTGQLGVAVDNKERLYISFGGPNLRFGSKKFGIAAMMFPSLRYVPATGKSDPALGFGPQINVHKLVLIAPFYYTANNQQWYWAVGLGYKFK